MIEFIKSSYFRDLLASFSVGVVLFTKQGSVYAINEAAVSTLALNEKRYEGRHWKDVFANIENMGALEEIVNYSTERQTRSGPVKTTISSRGDKILHLSLSTSVLLYFEKIWGIMVEINDITDIYLLHEREKQILKEKSLVQVERSESLKKMSMAVAHQIRNPTTAIGGMARLLLKKTDLNGESSSYLNAILNSSKRLEEIVDTAFDYSRIQLGKKEPTPLKLIVFSAKERLAADNIQWEIELPEISINVDLSLFVDAVYEILKNSVEALQGNHGKVSISAHVLLDFCVIEIADTGPGISEKDMPFIFDPYFSTKPMGIGMGMCKTERIIKEHMGTIELESKDGKGVRIIIKAPYEKVD